MSTARALAAGHLGVQAVAVPVWWAGLRLSPTFRRPFELGDPAVLDSFAPGDVVLALTSAAAAVLVRAGHPAAAPAAGVVTAVVGWSTVRTVRCAAASRSGGLGVLAMTAATAGSAVAWVLARSTR
ncbi:hypothetical protein AB1207_11685 [Kineococcus endophyticus]|uniref:Uncharacterized protein n=1 Tax=Kineococcus endophyticus TaxID=1181883 RepID=A0ABV3P7C3_9ACTN